MGVGISPGNFDFMKIHKQDKSLSIKHEGEEDSWHFLSSALQSLSLIPCVTLQGYKEYEEDIQDCCAVHETRKEEYQVSQFQVLVIPMGVALLPHEF